MRKKYGRSQRTPYHSKQTSSFIYLKHSFYSNQHPFKWAYSTAFVIPKLARALAREGHVFKQFKFLIGGSKCRSDQFHCLCYNRRAMSKYFKEVLYKSIWTFPMFYLHVSYIIGEKFSHNLYNIILFILSGLDF